MQVTVLYFAQFADLAGKESELIELSDPSPGKLYAEVRERYAFPHDFGAIQVAINHQLCAHTGSLEDGDAIAFLPPMTGG